MAIERICRKRARRQRGHAEPEYCGDQVPFGQHTEDCLLSFRDVSLDMRVSQPNSQRTRLCSVGAALFMPRILSVSLVCPINSFTRLVADTPPSLPLVRGRN